MATARPQSIDEINPWSKWGIALSNRQGRPALSESALWFLELRHPEVLDREGADLWLHLDQPYKVVRQSDRSWVRLEPAPFRTKKAA
jgi:hypothetical protein